MKRRSKVSLKDKKRKMIHVNLIKAISIKQKKLQMRENIKFGAKASKVTFEFASKEYARGRK